MLRMVLEQISYDHENLTNAVMVQQGTIDILENIPVASRHAYGTKRIIVIRNLLYIIVYYRFILIYKNFFIVVKFKSSENQEGPSFTDLNS